MSPSSSGSANSAVATESKPTKTPSRRGRGGSRPPSSPVEWDGESTRCSVCRTPTDFGSGIIYEASRPRMRVCLRCWPEVCGSVEARP